MLPAWNIYNGFGTGWGWAQRMRLDRMIVQGAALDWERARARLFANELIHKGQRAAGEPEEPWQAYLFPSDHFGVLVDIPLADAVPSTERAPPSAPLAPNAKWLYGGRRGGVAIKLLALAAVRVAASRWLPIKARAAPRERRAVYLSGLQKIPRLRMYRRLHVVQRLTTHRLRTCSYHTQWKTLDKIYHIDVPLKLSKVLEFNAGETTLLKLVKLNSCSKYKNLICKNKT